MSQSKKYGDGYWVHRRHLCSCERKDLSFFLEMGVHCSPMSPIVHVYVPTLVVNSGGGGV